MPDPRNETPPPEGPDTRAASLEDLVAALGKPSGREPETDEDGEGQDAPEAEQTDAVDPYAEYADLDLATSLPIDPDDDLSKLKGEASPRLMSIVESLLFAASKPMTVKEIRRLLKEPTKRQIQLALKQLILDTQQRGVVLGQVAGGFRLRTHPDNAAFVQKMLAGRPVRLSRSQLESLAVAAYRQPVTKAELDHIRGVDCGAVLRVLLERDLVKIVGRKEEAGRPHLYGTTVAFLEFFNLKALRDLPDLHEFRELNEESEATLKHTMTGDLAAEQEAMGQGKLDFDPDAAAAADPEASVSNDEPEASSVADVAAGSDTPDGDGDGDGDGDAEDATAPSVGEGSPEGPSHPGGDTPAEPRAVSEDGATFDAASDPPVQDPPVAPEGEASAARPDGLDDETLLRANTDEDSLGGERPDVPLDADATADGDATADAESPEDPSRVAVAGETVSDVPSDALDEDPSTTLEEGPVEDVPQEQGTLTDAADADGPAVPEPVAHDDVSDVSAADGDVSPDAEAGPDAPEPDAYAEEADAPALRDADTASVTDVVLTEERASEAGPEDDAQMDASLDDTVDVSTEPVTSDPHAEPSPQESGSDVASTHGDSTPQDGEHAEADNGDES